MQKVRPSKHRHTSKLVKAGPIDKKKLRKAVDGLLAPGGGHHVSEQQSKAAAKPHAASRSEAYPRSYDGGKTVVERLRDRLDRLAVDSGLIAATSVGGSLTSKWLAGKPCSLDETRCAHRFQLVSDHVHLPFEPMAPQLAVVERALQACDQGGVALLQAPTGTGKSIALLTAVLAWQRRAFAAHGSAPQIIYGVRTHVQAKQMVGELQKTPYRPRMAIIGSRDQLCINAGATCR